MKLKIKFSHHGPLWPHRLNDRHQNPNFGPSGARNEGIKEAKGSYIFFQDADLEYNVDDLIKIYDFYNKNKSYKVIYGSRLLKKNYKKIYTSFNKDIIRIFGNIFCHLPKAIENPINWSIISLPVWLYSLNKNFRKYNIERLDEWTTNKK